jgi:hypothetical protein
VTISDPIVERADIVRSTSENERSLHQSWERIARCERRLGVKASSPDALQQRLVVGAFCEKLHVEFFLRDEAFVD